MTNFDHYLEENLENPAFAARFAEAGAAWEEKYSELTLSVQNLSLAERELIAKDSSEQALTPTPGK
jgi:hypothetical protein